MDVDQIERESDILARVRIAGGNTTPKRMARLSEAGLIGAPKQLHVPGLSGSITVYPTGTGDRILAIGGICRWRKRRFGWIGWQLWWHGQVVDEKFWLSPLRKWAAFFDSAIGLIEKIVYRGKRNDVSDDAFEAISKMRRFRTRDSLIRKLRKRVMPAHWDRAVLFIIEIGTGRFRGWKDAAYHDPQELETDKKILDSVLGIARARTDYVAGVTPWLPDDGEDALIALSRNLKGVKVAEVLRSTPTSELERNRDEIREIFEVVSSASAALEPIFGRHAFGFRVFAQIARRASPQLQGQMILLWPILKKSPWAQAKIDELRDKLPEARKMQADQAALAAKVRESPNLAKILTSSRIKKAMMDREEIKVIAAAIRRLNQYPT